MIPPFNASGVLPPFVGSTPTDRANQAPYITTMLELAERFCTSDERKNILIGLINYREMLRDVGFIEGSQWIDGSFVENSELIRGRPPGDVDIVTVAFRPNRMSDDEFDEFVDRNDMIFDQGAIKEQYKVDGYFIDLNIEGDLIAEDVFYWSNLFSHQRVSSLWKGMLKVPLQSDDEAALRFLLEDANHAQAA